MAPSGITDDDLLIAFLVSGGAGAAPAVTPPAGWAEMTGSPTLVNDGSFFVAYHIYFKVAAGEAGDYAFTHAAGSSCGLIIRYVGVDTSTPFAQRQLPTQEQGLSRLRWA